MSKGLLGDADIGWHIRTGEFILSSHTIPRSDLFSYTKSGQPWYAWEWLYDAGIAAIHHVAGLNGVVIFSAIVIAASFALLFRSVLRRSGDFVVALGVTLLAAAASQVHMLARPHILSWLFALLWVDALYRFEAGSQRALLTLPPMMLVWVNVHGGFVLGLVLLALFCVVSIWDYLGVRSAAKLQQVCQLLTASCACLFVTFATPYGYKLHLHVFQYLSNSFLMNSISEFMSPNFHLPGVGYFEALILLSILALALRRDRISATDCVLLLFSVHVGLFAVRNVPIAAIIMALSLGPLLSGALSACEQREHPVWLHSALAALRGISVDMSVMEGRFRGHVIATATLVTALAIASNGGFLWSLPVLSAHFDDKVMPVKATEYISQSGLRDHLFNTDDWSGYLIYKLYPTTKLYFDDRHDFYGEAFIKEYFKATNGTSQWREPLDKYEVKWVLIATSSPLCAVMRESKQWQVVYEDRLAIVFSRSN